MCSNGGEVRENLQNTRLAGTREYTATESLTLANSPKWLYGLKSRSRAARRIIVEKFWLVATEIDVSSIQERGQLIPEVEVTSRRRVATGISPTFVFARSPIRPSICSFLVSVCAALYSLEQLWDCGWKITMIVITPTIKLTIIASCYRASPVFLFSFFLSPGYYSFHFYLLLFSSYGWLLLLYLSQRKRVFVRMCNASTIRMIHGRGYCHPPA